MCLQNNLHGYNNKVNFVFINWYTYESIILRWCTTTTNSSLSADKMTVTVRTKKDVVDLDTYYVVHVNVIRNVTSLIIISWLVFSVVFADAAGWATYSPYSSWKCKPDPINILLYAVKTILNWLHSFYDSRWIKLIHSYSLGAICVIS